MREWTPQQVAEAAAARLVSPPPASTTGGPKHALIDSRAVGPGDLFVGLPGANVDGGTFAVRALADGAWGVLVAPEHAEAARCATPGVLLAAEDPLAALGRLARAWRRELGARVVGITGSTGKTSTKDILAGMLAPHRRVHASRENFNTEIGLPLAILEAPAGTEVLVLELAMRGSGQIADLVEIAEPDVGVIVNVGPVHLELLGSIEAIAAAKAELIAGLAPGATAVVPAGEALLEPHRRSDIAWVTFGPGGDVSLAGAERGRATLQTPDGLVVLELGFTHAHQVVNALAAWAAARALDVTVAGEVAVSFSGLRGEEIVLPGQLTIVNDCYNANPMSMRAALDHLAETAPGRRVAVLGDMLELGAGERAYHEEIGRHAAQAGVDVLVTVGPLAAVMGPGFGGQTHAVADAAEAAALVSELLEPGDTVLVKGSRGVGLEVVAEALQNQLMER